ncbi:MAG: HAMP domain-containing protein [Rhodocyclales bacterium]|nr:HAMP domain-containing protein [Rhodocyclales bacterium]
MRLRRNRQRHATAPDANAAPRCRRPHSLFGRLMLIWLVGLTVVLGVSQGLILGERGRAARNTMFENLASDVVTVVALMDALPAAERPVWLARLERPRYRFLLAPLPAGHALAEDFDHPALTRLRQGMAGRAFEIRMALRRDDRHPTLYLGTRLGDGSPFLVEALAPRTQAPPARILASIAALVLGVVLLTWLAVRIATRPLSRLAQAAQALGEDLDRAPLPEEGPVEVRRAAVAFNRMQDRLRGLFSERTRILAAVSHDLQTPLTRMRLRAELMDDERLREKMLADLAAMQALVAEGLAYAGSTAAAKEAPCVTDLDALATSLVADYSDAGRPVSLAGRCGRAVGTRPRTLRRLLGNLIDNALKFGGNAELTLAASDHAIAIVVRDHGPGIPPAELDKVFEPFYRIESSRNRETGGTGLGLAIARQLAAVLGAELRLRNHPDGGLEARVSLPLETVRPSAQIGGQ